MKNKRMIPKKRKFRCDVIIDKLDWLILTRLDTACFKQFSDLKKSVNLSSKSLGLHIRRLVDLGLILVRASEKNYKSKIVSLTEQGKIMKMALYEGCRPKEARKYLYL